MQLVSKTGTVLDCCNKLSGLKQHAFNYLTILEVRSLKWRCWQGCVPSGCCRGDEISFLDFSASRGVLHSLVHSSSFE